MVNSNLRVSPLMHWVAFSKRIYRSEFIYDKIRLHLVKHKEKIKIGLLHDCPLISTYSPDIWFDRTRPYHWTTTHLRATAANACPTDSPKFHANIRTPRTLYSCKQIQKISGNLFLFILIFEFILNSFQSIFLFCSLQVELQEMNENNVNRIFNLKPALALIAEWETELSVDSIENTELIRHIQSEMDKLRSNVRYEMRFHERWLKKVCHSTVFVYPSLLPTTPFRFDTKKISEYLPSED